MAQNLNKDTDPHVQLFFIESYSERCMEPQGSGWRGVLCLPCKSFHLFMKTEKILAGIAGEYFVAGELSRMGMVAGLTLRNTADVDIVLTSQDGSQSSNIQVKTRRIDKSDCWDLGSKPLITKKEWENIFYVFVALSANLGDKNVEYYIIPKNLANEKIEKVFSDWSAGKTKAGKSRNSQRRMFRLKELPEFEKYKNKWEVIFDKSSKD